MPYATFVTVKGENTGLYHAVASLSWFALLCHAHHTMRHESLT